MTPCLLTALRRPVLLAALGLGALLSGHAQVAPPAPATTRTGADQTVTLSPFIVSTENEAGWSANDTLSATRTKQALKDVPVNIDAITADFMEDLGLFNADEFANYVANAFAPPTLENDNQSGAIAFRDLSGSTEVGGLHRIEERARVETRNIEEEAEADAIGVCFSGCHVVVIVSPASSNVEAS